MIRKPDDGWEISCSTIEKVMERVRRTSVFYYYTTMLKT